MKLFLSIFSLAFLVFPVYADNNIRVEVRQYPHQSIGQIKVNHTFLSSPTVSEPTKIQLTFFVGKAETIRLSFKEEASMSVLQGDNITLNADNNGYATTTIDVVANNAGKHYIRLFAQTDDNTKQRAYVIILKVPDQSGVVPTLRKSKKDRINLPSKTL